MAVGNGMMDAVLRMVEGGMMAMADDDDDE
jgi:hypothetical protein